MHPSSIYQKKTWKALNLRCTPWSLGCDLDVSENSGFSPQIIHFYRDSIRNHPFWGTSIFGNNHLLDLVLQVETWIWIFVHPKTPDFCSLQKKGVILRFAKTPLVQSLAIGGSLGSLGAGDFCKEMLGRFGFFLPLRVGPAYYSIWKVSTGSLGSHSQENRRERERERYRSEIRLNHRLRCIKPL